MDAHALDREYLSPEPCQHLLERRPRGDEAFRWHVLCPIGCCQAELCRQANTLQLARWAFRKVLHDEHLTRDLKISQTHSSELANLCHCHRSLWAQHDGRRDILT
jgi:hypothetical protein